MKPLQTYLSEASDDTKSEKSLWTQLPNMIEIIREDGASFFLKIDGERERNVFTLLIQGGPLGGDGIRTETSDLLTGLKSVFSEYSTRFKC